MATLSPSKARTAPGCVPLPMDHKHHSPQRAALIPRSALPEPGMIGPVDDSPHTASLSAMQAMQAFDSDNARSGALFLSTEGTHQGSRLENASANDTSAHDARDSDVETIQSSSNASIDIITERKTINYEDVKSASPRKPLPAQWLSPSISPTLATAQRARAHDRTKASPSGPPVDRKSVRPTRSSLDIGRAYAEGPTFLTKNALDAFDADITSPTFRRSPSKTQQSPTKVPWNSPIAPPKIGSLCHNAGSPTKPLPPRTAQLSSHMTANHKRSPSSIVSTGATSFHTAHGSPVRSPACSQSSFSSASGLQYNTPPTFPDNVADVHAEQIDEQNSTSKINTIRTATGNRTVALRPELSISIPSSDNAIHVEPKPNSTFGSVTDNSVASIGRDHGLKSDLLEGSHLPVSVTQPSRIPRRSVSKGSSAHAPTLSSTLKQTKSAQTLRSPKAMTHRSGSNHVTAAKITTTRSMRHVRTVDSRGSTPILSGHNRCDFSTSKSVAGVAPVGTECKTRANHEDYISSFLRDSVIGAPSSTKSLPESSTPSRATSNSTIKATQITDGSVSMNPNSASSCVGSEGNIHSSDADDEYDDSITSAPGSGDGPRSNSPVPGRSAQYDHSIHHVTASTVSMESSSGSDLRATATEFVPAQGTISQCEKVACDQPPPGLPDLYALDGYGIPWYYHMYPVPWLLPPMYTKGRSRSPKKLRPKKQRSTPMNNQQDQNCVVSPIEMGSTAITAADVTTSQSEGTAQDAAESNPPNPTRAFALGASYYVNSSDGPFAAQLDTIARQTALQTSTDTMRWPQIDLTTIRNVPAHSHSQAGSVEGYSTVPARRRTHRQTGNGLYGGRGNVGVPLYATAPFPNPVPPMGRPTHTQEYVGYTVGTKACGIIAIEKAAEHGGQSCNTCEPDH